MAKLEYEVDRRLHYHVVFFYDGQKIKNDYLLAQALGEYWVDTITRGLGGYYSANMNSDKYKAFALGGIVYTPVEVVGFIIYSVENVMRKEFNSSLANKNVHIIDLFTGTGTFITRLLQSGQSTSGRLLSRRE